MAEPVRDSELKARIDQVLSAFVEQEAGLLVAIDAQLKPVADQLRTAVADGKRLRAAFAYWGWRAAGQPDSEAMVRAAAAMELVHAAAVVHDDLIDESPIRRGAPTAHLALRYAVAEGPGQDAAGRALAMLTGDLLMSWAGQLFAGCGLPAAYLARARPLWATLARELVAGECLEILRTRAAPSEASSLEIVRYKTAKYTVEHPLHLGGLLAGAPPALLDTFTAYGVPLGEAFQLRDDLLGVFGDPRRTGKSNLDDLAGAKPTALLALTLAGATGPDRARLRALLGRDDLGPAELDGLRGIMIRSGARTRVEELIAERATAARGALGRAALPSQAATALAELVTAATARTS
ncbi:geranylgeranyl diphosphate synthase type I [Kitasatospora gansuensis]|uniref:Geranylgeranyl diphosphate synthase type I n=1 Tax=Kitasatospora gansuensis TaxID=258050 RepID=A0A7W7SE17_9ACTN|nr:polyprenyl synthetase family protein [Kitasatospora gansuensis]MBB4948572.1 geranylgeranyl diphosphate synthase type I [Kitasatospora gansuensis]